MTGAALILAAHGSRVDSRTNEALVALAERIGARRLFHEVAVAFHHGTPTFASVLDDLCAADAVVVPVMTSAGYYCDDVLPRELAKNRRAARFRLCQTPPVGTHPGLAELVARRAAQLATDHGVEPSQAALALVGHGTARHAKSRVATEQLAARLTKTGTWAKVLTAFLDEDPGVETILSLSSTTDVVVIPFLISGGPHATVDIPSRLGLSPQAEPPFGESLAGRRIILDRAIGTDPSIEDIIVDLATAALRLERVA